MTELLAWEKRILRRSIEISIIFQHMSNMSPFLG